MTNKCLNDECSLYKTSLTITYLRLAALLNDNLNLPQDVAICLENVVDFAETASSGKYACGSCLVPEKLAEKGTRWTQCDSCDTWFHDSCAFISCDSRPSETEKWFCFYCDDSKISSDSHQQFGTPQPEHGSSDVAVEIPQQNYKDTTPSKKDPMTYAECLSSDVNIKSKHVPEIVNNKTVDHKTKPSDVQSVSKSFSQSQSKFNLRTLKINRQKRNTLIICDSQGKTIKPFLLDPSRNTKVLTFRGMELVHLHQRLAATEQYPNKNVSRVVLFLGGNDLNKMKSNTGEFLSAVNMSIVELKKIFPDAALFLTSVLPRKDCRSPALLDPLIKDWCSSNNVTFIQFSALTPNHIDSKDGIHLNEDGVKKVCRALKVALNFPAKKKLKRVVQQEPRQQQLNSSHSVHPGSRRLDVYRPPTRHSMQNHLQPSARIQYQRGLLKPSLAVKNLRPHPYSPPNLNWQEQRTLIAAVVQEMLPSMLAQQRQHSPPFVPPPLFQDQNVHHAVTPQIPPQGIWPPPAGHPPPPPQVQANYYSGM